MVLKHEALALYRQALRIAREFPDKSMAKKLIYNARELTRLRRHETSDAKIRRYLSDGHEQLRVYQLLQHDKELLAAITRKSKQSEEK